jgi:hypothetical protein
MSEDQHNDLEKYIGTLKWVVGLGWALLAGAFGLGLWVATLEIRQASFTNKIFDTEVQIKSHASEINAIHVKQAVNASDLTYIRNTIDRIEKKLP